MRFVITARHLSKHQIERTLPNSVSYTIGQVHTVDYYVVGGTMAEFGAEDSIILRTWLEVYLRADLRISKSY